MNGTDAPDTDTTTTSPYPPGMDPCMRLESKTKADMTQMANAQLADYSRQEMLELLLGKRGNLMPDAYRIGVLGLIANGTHMSSLDNMHWFDPTETSLGKMLMELNVKQLVDVLVARLGSLDVEVVRRVLCHILK